MKKIGAIVFVVLFLFFCHVEIATAGGIRLFFDYQDGEVSKQYVEFTYEFGGQLLEKTKKYSFKDSYTVKVEESVGTIRHKDGKIEEEMVIVVVINEEDKPLWVRVKNLSSSEKIKEKAREFSEKVFQRLLRMEREKKRPAVKKIRV